MLAWIIVPANRLGTKCCAIKHLRLLASASVGPGSAAGRPRRGWDGAGLDGAGVQFNRLWWLTNCLRGGSGFATVGLGGLGGSRREAFAGWAARGGRPGRAGRLPGPGLGYSAELRRVVGAVNGAGEGWLAEVGRGGPARPRPERAGMRRGRRGRHPARPARAEMRVGPRGQHPARPARAEIRLRDMLKGTNSTPQGGLGYKSMPHMHN